MGRKTIGMAHKTRQKTKGRTPDKRPPVALRSRRRWIVATVAISILLLVGAYAGWWRARGSSRAFPGTLHAGSASGFHVLLITLDTTRADHLGCYGHAAAKTPVLDRLAAEGVRFADAVSPAPITLTSHATMLTGHDPPRHGVRHNGDFRLDQRFVSLAEVLQSKGYATSAFISAFVLDARFGLKQGFDVYDDTVNVAEDPSFGYSERPANAVTDAALRWLRGHDRSKPFFAWVHYYDPHHPCAPPQPYASMFRANLYDGEIAFMDAQIGRLIAAIDELRLNDKTLVFVVGDHGESLGEHLEASHSRFLYEATQHVPLILWSPALVSRPAVVDDVVVGVVDVMPTILELLGFPIPSGLDGLSLLHCRESPGRMVYMETLAAYMESGWAPLYGLRRHQDKYILAPRPEYYDLATDPRELQNLYGRTSRPAAAELAEEMARRIAESPSIEAVAASAVPLDLEARRRLESLGYVAGASPDDDVGQPDPKDMMPLWNKYLVIKELADAGQVEQALPKIKELLAVAPNDAMILRKLAQVYLRMGREPEAEEILRRCIALRPNSNVFLLLAQIMTRDQRFSEAEEMLDKAAALEPEHGGVLIARGDLLVMKSRFTEALGRYEEAIRVDPYRAKVLATDRITKIRAEQGRNP